MTTGKDKAQVYVVVMTGAYLVHGDHPEGITYLVGVFENKKKADQAAVDERAKNKFANVSVLPCELTR